MPIRNPFARRPGLAPAAAQQDENARPSSALADPSRPGFERVDTVGSKASSALSVRSRRSEDTGEYKMSVVNDSGVYLPPSPTEKHTPWPRRYLSSRTSTDTRSSTGEIEHFSISRESFDSYRRSFDISARSPVIVPDPAPRQSLDSARFPRYPRSALADRRLERRREPPTTEEEGFEDVGLGDDKQPPPPHRRRGFFKFSSDNSNQDPSAAAAAAQASATTSQPISSTMARFLPGRKRGQSGQGSELGAMPAADRPGTGAGSAPTTPRIEVEGAGA